MFHDALAWCNLKQGHLKTTLLQSGWTSCSLSHTMCNMVCNLIQCTRMLWKYTLNPQLATPWPGIGWMVVDEFWPLRPDATRCWGGFLGTCPCFEQFWPAKLLQKKSIRWLYRHWEDRLNWEAQLLEEEFGKMTLGQKMDKLNEDTSLSFLSHFI